MLRRFMSSRMSTGAAPSLEHLQQTLLNALELAASVEDSANALYLETDPSARQPRASYLAHYQAMAQSQLDQALDKVEETKNTMDESGWKEWVRSSIKSSGGGSSPSGHSFEVLVADSRLKRDHLQAALREVQARQAANEITCDD